MFITLSLPKGVKLLVKQNDAVDFDSKLYEKGETSEICIRLAAKLGINPSKIFKHLTKFVGEEVEKGELLATKKNLFGHSSYHAEHTGIIKEINHNTGEIIIQTSSDKKSHKNAYFKGLVYEIKNDEIVLKVKDGKSLELKETVEDFGESIYYFKSNTAIIMDDIKNKVVICEALDELTQVKVEALGCCGFITLQPLKTSSNLPKAYLKNISDFSELINYNFKYCLANKKANQVHFYNS